MSWNNNTFYDSASQYGWQPISGEGNSYFGTPQEINDTNSNNKSRGDFVRWLTNQNSAGFGRKDLFGQSLFNKATQGYEAATQMNPTLSFRDYLNSLNTNFVQNMWSGLTPEQRGESPQRYAGPVRWMSRG